MELYNNNHSVFSMNYHLILVVKYRRDVIDDEISERLLGYFPESRHPTTSTLKNGTMIGIMSMCFSGRSRTVSCRSSLTPINQHPVA